MKMLLLTVFIPALLHCAESCEDKRKRLEELRTQMQVEHAGKVVSWLTMSWPTSSRDKTLKQQIVILRMELEQCTLHSDASSTKTPSFSKPH